MSTRRRGDKVSKEKINVTKAFLPPLEKYTTYLEQIWDRVQLTNQGPLLQQLEQRIGDYLRVGTKDLHFVTNGTLALQLAIRALDITDGEIITTPFSYVATTSAILWERCKPVYVDIDPQTFCIDPAKIEAAITPRTKAIMPVHVFGQPCDVKAIADIAARHKLKVIYDAAHAFGVEHDGKALLAYGDVSICSFHATKLFHTIEGGLVIAKDKVVGEKLELLKRFGHEGDTHHMAGMNAKASEFQAAMGLCNLDYVEENIAKRKRVVERYNKRLAGAFQTMQHKAHGVSNYAYYPLVVETEALLHSLLAKLAAQNIGARRYFYPSLNTLPHHGSTEACPVSEDIASRIMCLPLYGDLPLKIVDEICDVLLGGSREKQPA